MEALRPDDAFALLGNGLDPETVGVFTQRPMVAVSLDEEPSHHELWRTLSALPCVVVGIGQPGASHAGAADIVVTDAPDAPRPWLSAPGGDVPAALGQLETAVSASPQAAVTLVQLLRLGEDLDPIEALVAESLAYGLLQTGDRHQQWLHDRSKPRHRATDQPPVLVERTDGAVRLTLDRPEARNAYDIATRDALVTALRAAAHDPTVLEIELCGAGPDFCAGGDLSEFGTVPTPATGHLVRTTRSAGVTLVQARAHTVARLHGACIGAGIELPAFCDHVVADATSTAIRLPEIAFGLIPGAGGTASIPRRIGRHRTAWLALTGATLDAPTALTWGLVDELG
jgi:hypothetical protein